MSIQYILSKEAKKKKQNKTKQTDNKFTSYCRSLHLGPVSNTRATLF